MIHPLVLAAVVLATLCLLGWWQQRRTNNAGYADVIWVFGVGLTALAYLFPGGGQVLPRMVAGALIALWSIRLGVYIWHRVRNSKAEDGRYRAMREALGPRINLFHFFFFQAQGLFVWLFALPFWVIATNPRPVPLLAISAGTLVGIVALTGESLADRQLDRFRRDPANQGRACRDGLWRYSRHPNYFFEWLHWFAYPLLAWGASHGGWLWLAPVLMFVFLWFVTGIPYTERQALRSRGADYRAYQQETSVFFPWWPAKERRK